MARFLIILAVAAVVFTVISIVDCAVQPDSRHRGVSKGAWVVITLVPVIGGILWWTIGRARPGYAQAAGPNPAAPDDNPEFLSAADERIRRLEEELAMLDAEEQFDDADVPRYDEKDQADGEAEQKDDAESDDDSADGDADSRKPGDGDDPRDARD